MREKIGKAGEATYSFAGKIYFRLLSIIPFVLTWVTGSAFLDAVKAADVAGMALMGVLTAGFAALVWYLWRPKRHLAELD